MDTKEFNFYIKNAYVDYSSLKAIFDFYYPKIVLHIRLKFCPEIAEDVAQDFFLKILNGNFREINPIEYPTAWVYTVCDNMAINMLRQQSKFDSIADTDDYAVEPDFSDSEYVDELTAGLTDDEKKLIYMRHYEGYSLKEIAALNGQKYANVRKKYSLTMKKMKKVEQTVHKTPF